MARRRRRRVPEALRRAFGGRARSLEDAILSLLPHTPTSPSQCRCLGRRCLGCGGSGYLLRRDDPPDYRNLLVRAVCVVPSGAPPPALLYSSDSPLSQRQIVRNAMELMMDKPQVTTNVLCSNYDKQTRFSPIGKFLCTCTWDLLLTRIGNALMLFLLQFSSIFVPIANKNHYQITGNPFNCILQSPELFHTPSTLGNHQSLCLKNKSTPSLRPTLKRRRDDLEEGPSMDFSFPALQPNNQLVGDSLASDCHGIAVAKHKRHAKDGQRMSRQTDVQCILEDHTADIIHDTNIFSLKTQHKSNNNLHFQSEKFKRQHSRNVICQTCALEQKESICSLKSCTSKSGKAIKAENLLCSHAKVMHHKQEASSCSQNKCHSIDSNIADIFEKSSLHVLNSKSRKHGRLFSWQRHKKRKVSCSGENLFMGNNEGFSSMKHKQNRDADFNHQSAESAEPFIYAVASELCDVNDRELTVFPPSVVMEDAETIDHVNSHSVHIEEVYQGHSLSSENNHHLPKAISKDRYEKESPAESPPDELLSKYVGSFKNQHRLHSHSDKISSQCFYCLMLQASSKVPVGTQIKRKYVFYNRFSSCSVFPRNHILNRLKPNNSGAISLMNLIFGFHNEHLNLLTCLSCNGFCDIKSKCLYHSLLSSLKALIRNARKCQHKKLLLKHCPITTFRHPNKDENRSASKGTYKRIKKKDLFDLLREHLKHNVLQVGQNFYLQKSGISQGSLLSSLLCSFYYGYMERNVIYPYLEKAHRLLNANFMVDENLFHGIKPVKDDATFIGQCSAIDLDKESVVVIDKMHWCHNNHATNVCVTGTNSENSSLPDNLLLRFIDDILFISTSKKQASHFFNRLRRGFRDYNCCMNDKKFGLNFEVEQNRHLVNRVYTGEDGISFLPWSGLLLNCRTLDIQVDYSRYCNATINSTITVNAHGRPMCQLRAKLCDHVRIKCHPILYDSNINSPAIVRLNAYQAFLLGAMKFHCYVCNISETINPSASCLLKMIEWSFCYMYKFIKKRMYDMKIRFNIHPVLRLKKAEAIWLGLSAYIRVLKKKQSRHKELLSLLRTRIAAYGKMDTASSHLRYAVDDSHSSAFWKMKF